MKRRKNAAAACLLLLGLVLVGIGLWRGEAAIVMQKGVRVCLECIGIG